MPNPLLIHDLKTELTQRQLPTITVWNRLEGRPRSIHFDRALRAEVRDALWMLTRQWQLGEFHGDDAGSPVLAKVEVSESTLTGFQPRDTDAVAFDETLPLEAVVERRNLDLVSAGSAGALDLRAAIGRMFLKLVPAIYHQRFIDHYGFTVPDPDNADDTDRVAHLEVWATLQALSGRAMDGYLLVQHLAGGGSVLSGVSVLAADKPALIAAGKQLLDWFKQLFTLPTDQTAWDPQRLEHRFAVTSMVGDGDKRLIAEEYPGGRLDWTTFSIDPKGARGSGKFREPITMLPTATRFNGMPDARWWAFEDGRTNIGDIRADTTDLARMLFVEFALAYGNDWFTVPCEVRDGTIATVEGVAITNVFGERLWITAAGRGVDDDWARWSMYTLDVAGTDRQPADTSLFRPPTVPHATTGPVLEEIVLMRDEIANMVWGVEQVVTLATGVGQRGAEVAAEALEHRRQLAGDPTSEPAGLETSAVISYQLMSSVPENWIPFVPVHLPGDVRETQLQRASMPRLIEGAPIERVRPRTSLLRTGLDATPGQSYYVHEEEVPRAGTHVSLSFQRARWRSGRTLVWLGATRETGRGEGSSGLAFDQIIPKPPSSGGH